MSYSDNVHILEKPEFVETYSKHFYELFPSREDAKNYLNAKIDNKLERSTSRTDTGLYIDNRDCIIETLLRCLWDNKNYINFLDSYFEMKLKLDPNILFKSYQKANKGLTLIKDTGGFKATGQDVGRKIIQNINYRDIFSLQKARPTDVTVVEAWKNVLDMKHLMYPAFINNILDGEFDDANFGPKIMHDKLIKFASIFGGKASVFNPNTYAFLMKTYAPDAKNALHCVGSWGTPALAAASLKLDHQVIIDVIPRLKGVCEYINKNFIPRSLVHKGTKLDVYICPSEKLEERHDFANKYKDHFDIQIFSPVYFDVELYNTIESDAGEQSIDSFPLYSDWLEGYFQATANTIFKVMKPGGKTITVITDHEIEDKATKTYRRIARDMEDAMIKAGFVKQEIVPLVLTSGSAMTSKKQKEKRRDERKTLFAEECQVFYKPLN